MTKTSSKKRATVRRKRTVRRVRDQVAKRGPMERYRIRNIARRDSMKEYLDEHLAIIDPDELIARPLDKRGWDRMIDNGLKAYRAGTEDEFDAWKARREARGGHTDLEVAVFLETKDDLRVCRMKGAELKQFLDRVESFELDDDFKAWVKTLKGQPMPEDRIRKVVDEYLEEMFGKKKK